MNTGPVLVDVAVKDLSGAALDWAVAKALGYVDYPDDSVEQGAWWYTDPVKAPFSERIRKVDWKPSTDWRQGGPLIKKFQVDIDHKRYVEGDHRYVVVFACCRLEGGSVAYGDAEELVAVCLAVVAFKLGDIVKVPACLVLP